VAARVLPMSALRKALARYVTLRRALGAKLREPAAALSGFVELLEREGAHFITSRLAVQWATRPSGVQPATWARRLGHVRGFAAFLAAEDARTEIPPVHLLLARKRRPNPHIYSQEEIGLLMSSALALRPRGGLRGPSLATLIGLLASSGLRPGEALALDVGDVDLRHGVLAVRDTKHGQSRFVPISPSTRAALRTYAAQRSARVGARSTDAFFVSARGRRLDAAATRRAFGGLARAIGLRPHACARRVGRGPRLQDVRHTFATRRLIAWYRAGADVARRMSALSTYLGHAAVAHTYWYVEAVPELLRLATERLSRGGAAR